MISLYHAEKFSVFRCCSDSPVVFFFFPFGIEVEGWEQALCDDLLSKHEATTQGQHLVCFPVIQIDDCNRLTN